MEITEQELERVLKCPMMDIAPSNMDSYIHAAVQWALLRTFERKFGDDPDKALKDIRAKLITLWKDYQMVGDPGSIARTAGFRMFNLVLNFSVIHPEQPYNVTLNGYTIKGRYALLQKRKGAELPYVLILHANAPALQKDVILPPDVKSMARFLHARVNAGYTDVQVLHYPVITGKWWLNKTINPALAQRCLQDMLKIVAPRPRFPVIGDHCRGCATQPCLEVFSNGQDDNSGI